MPSQPAWAVLSAGSDLASVQGKAVGSWGIDPEMAAGPIVPEFRREGGSGESQARTGLRLFPVTVLTISAASLAVLRSVPGKRCPNHLDETPPWW